MKTRLIHLLAFALLPGSVWVAAGTTFNVPVVVAKSGDADTAGRTITRVSGAPSINDSGVVAFVGETTDTTGTQVHRRENLFSVIPPQSRPRPLMAPEYEHPNEPYVDPEPFHPWQKFYGSQINNNGTVVSVRHLQTYGLQNAHLPPPAGMIDAYILMAHVEQWPSETTSSRATLVDVGPTLACIEYHTGWLVFKNPATAGERPSPLPFESAWADGMRSRPAALNNNSQSTYIARHNGQAYLASSSRKTPFQPINSSARTGSIADDGTIVFNLDTGATRGITVFTADLSSSSTIAPTTYFSTLGSFPRISDDGTCIAFYGDLSAVGASALGLSPGAGVFAAVKQTPGPAVTAAWRVFRIAGASASGPIAQFALEDYCGVGNGLPMPQPILGSHRYVVYLAQQPDGNRGVFCTRLEPNNVSQPAALPVLIAKQGDTLVGVQGRITTLALFDPINNQPDPSIALWLQTDAGQTAVAVSRPMPIVPIQSVFNWQPDAAAKNRFALVAKKDMVLRVFFDTGPQGTTTEALAKLWIDGRETPFDARNVVYPSTKTFTVSERRQALNSLNIVIRGAAAETWLDVGIHALKVEVTPAIPGLFPTASATVSGEFRESRKLELFLVPISMPAASGSGVVSPDRALFKDAAELIKSSFPIDEDNVRLKVVELQPTHLFDPLKPLPPDYSQGYAGQTDIFAKDVQAAKAGFLHLAGIPDYAYYVAVYPSSGWSKPPLGSLGWSMGQIVAVYDRVWELQGFQRHRSPCLAALLAHEVGHLFTLDSATMLGDEYYFPINDSTAQYAKPWNPPHSINNDATGTAAGNFVLEEHLAFDVRETRAALAENDPYVNPKPDDCPKAIFAVPVLEADPLALGPVYGFMQGSGSKQGLPEILAGLTDTRSWATRDEYQHMYKHFTRPLGVQTPRERKDDPPSRELLLVSGYTVTNGGACLRGFFSCNSTAEFPPPAGTDYTLQLCSQAGTVLSQVQFGASYVNSFIDDGFLPTEVSAFCFGVDLVPGTASVRLLKLGVVLATTSVGTNKPTASIPFVQHLPDNNLHLTWSGDDPDGDEMHYMVVYSPDGVDNYVLVSDTTNTSLTVSLAHYPPPSGNATVTVHAYDGFNWSEAALVFNPLLTAEKSGNQVALSWPSAAPGFQLQAAASLATAGTWNWVTNTPTVVGGRWQVKLNASGNSQFFRLGKP